jgi:hypothetical protein
LFLLLVRIMGSSLMDIYTTMETERFREMSGGIEDRGNYGTPWDEWYTRIYAPVICWTG